MSFGNDPSIFLAHDFLWTVCNDGSVNLVVVCAIKKILNVPGAHFMFYWITHATTTLGFKWTIITHN